MTAAIVILVDRLALDPEAVAALRADARALDPEAVLVGLSVADLALVAAYVARIAGLKP